MRLIVKCLQCICCNGVCLLIISQQGIEAKFADDAKWFRSVRDSDMETRQNEGTRQCMWVWFLFWFSSFFLIQIKVISIERNCEVPCSTGLCSKWSVNSFSARSASYYRWSRRNLCLIPMKEKGFWLKKGATRTGQNSIWVSYFSPYHPLTVNNLCSCSLPVLIKVHPVKEINST